MNLWPMIIPWDKFFFLHLFRQLFIIQRTVEWCKCDIWWTLYDRLTLTIKWKCTGVTLICSKLTSNSSNSHSFTISYEDSALAWSYEKETIFTVINIDIGCDIEDKICTSFAVIDIILLLLDRIYLFNFKSIILIFKAIIIRIIFLFCYLWFQYICLKFRYLFHFLLRLFLH